MSKPSQPGLTYLSRCCISYLASQKRWSVGTANFISRCGQALLCLLAFMHAVPCSWNLLSSLSEGQFLFFQEAAVSECPWSSSPTTPSFPADQHDWCTLCTPASHRACVLAALSGPCKDLFSLSLPQRSLIEGPRVWHQLGICWTTQCLRWCRWKLY